MALAKTYNPKEVEPRWQAAWQAAGVYHYSPQSEAPVYSIDTPPPTVSGYLHLGHVYSYTHPDLAARFWRMRGKNIFYPMGYDDNGLPTERLVEKRLGITAAQVGRSAFIEKCLQVSEEAEADYQALWQRLGLSIDWGHTYRTIDERSRRTSQFSFIELYRKGLAYQQEAPAIWCPECRTAIAQAELNDLERESEFLTLKFPLHPYSPSPLSPQGSRGEGDRGGDDRAENSYLLIATTRPELLPACAAVFIHPEDARYRGLAGRSAVVPLFGQSVPILEDPGVEPDKGTGAVMCCTFGDTADVAWWRAHRLPLVEAIDRQGRMTRTAGRYAGLPIQAARREIKGSLEEAGLLLGSQPLQQSVRVHERCDTPVEYIVARQWFIRVLDFKKEFLEAGEKIAWHPESMRARYRAWVENLNWDWCISRQRYFGVPFPVWYCGACGEVRLAEADQLPVDPTQDQPRGPCPSCGGSAFIPEEDIFDTWATSSLSPQIAGEWLPGILDPPGTEDGQPRLYPQVSPFSLRPQAHEIIRTWAFYTIVKSHFHFGALPWKEVLISGWGLAGEGMGKISKSRGGGPLPPMEMIERYSADAVRYWAASTSPGKDSVISEEKIQTGTRLVTKLWNVARFAERFIVSYSPPSSLKGSRGKGEKGNPSSPTPLLPYSPDSLSPADRWILSRLQRLVRSATGLMERCDYAAAKSEIESFFWTELADNYLEMCKQRLYDESHPQREGARASLHTILGTLLKLFAPFLPFVTEEIYQGLTAGERQDSTSQGIGEKGIRSIHRSKWPVPNPALEDERAEEVGQVLVEIATAVRRYKSEASLSLGAELSRLQLAVVEDDERLVKVLQDAAADLKSITRARQVDIISQARPKESPAANSRVVVTAIEEV